MDAGKRRACASFGSPLKRRAGAAATGRPELLGLHHPVDLGFWCEITGGLGFGFGFTAGLRGAVLTSAESLSVTFSPSGAVPTTEATFV